jgi:microcystin-dependent protein
LWFVYFQLSFECRLIVQCFLFKCSLLSSRQKQWIRYKELVAEHMDFRESRLPPGAYAAALQEKASTAAAQARSAAARNPRSAQAAAAATAAAAALGSTAGLRDGASHRHCHCYCHFVLYVVVYVLF